MNRFAALLFVLLIPSLALAMPAPMEPPRLVNDFVDLFPVEERDALEKMLRRYHDETSTQIYVVTVSSLDGKDSLVYATELGNAWGVGQKGKDNGLVILIKPKVPGESGDVAIATGDGVTPLINRQAVQKIVDNVVIPLFRKDMYTEGVRQAATMFDLLLKESFSPGAAPQKSSGGLAQYSWLIILVAILLGLPAVLYITGHKDAAKAILVFVGTVAVALFTIAAIFSGRGSRRGGPSGGGGFSGGGGGRFSGGGASGKW